MAQTEMERRDQVCRYALQVVRDVCFEDTGKSIEIWQMSDSDLENALYDPRVYNTVEDLDIDDVFKFTGRE